MENKTVVKEVDINIDELLGVPGADNIMVPEDKKKSAPEKKPNLFTTKPVDLSFLEEEIEEEGDKKSEVPDGETPADKTVAPKKEVDTSILDIDAKEKEEKVQTGKKLDKSGLVELTNKLIKKGILVPFEDEKPMEEYTLADFEELVEANIKEKEKSILDEAEDSIFGSLPVELQVAAKYVKDGGQDLKSLFKQLAAVEEVRELDPEDEADQEVIVRSYLQATRFGTVDEIDDEITELKDRGSLKNKAAQFKPKLDMLQEEMVAYKLKEQEDLVRRQQKQMKMYESNVYKTLESAEINGLKLDKKTQNMLYAGLTQPNYPSATGRQTNLFGHLLEKYQYIEPNYGLMAEALWLLSDPEGYRAKVKESATKETTEKHVRMLKTEQSNRIASTPDDDQTYFSEGKKQTKISRPTADFFKR